jgi:hypothetical protein
VSARVSGVRVEDSCRELGWRSYRAVRIAGVQTAAVVAAARSFVVVVFAAAAGNTADTVAAGFGIVEVVVAVAACAAGRDFARSKQGRSFAAPGIEAAAVAEVEIEFDIVEIGPMLLAWVVPLEAGRRSPLADRTLERAMLSSFG